MYIYIIYMYIILILIQIILKICNEKLMPINLFYNNTLKRNYNFSGD